MKKVTRREIARMSAREFAAAARDPYRRLISFLKPYRRRFALGLLCGALYGLLNGALVFTVNHVTRTVLPGKEPARPNNTTAAEVWREDRELPELRAAMAAAKVPAGQQEPAAESYAAFRKLAHDRAVTAQTGKMEDPLVKASLHPALPAEFRLCLEGERLLLTGGDTALPDTGGIGGWLASKFGQAELPAHVLAAREKWKELLALPEDARRHRTIWAHFLLAQTEPDKKEQTNHFAALHDAAGSGRFTDVLKLAGSAPKPSPLLTIVLICASIPALMFIRAVFGYLNTYCLTWVSLRVLDDIRGRLFEKVLGQSMEFFNKQKAGDLLQTILNQTRVAQQALTGVAGEIVKEPLSILSALAMLFIIDPKFTLFSFLLIPLCIIPVIIIGKKVRAAGAQEEEEAGEMAVIMQEAFTGIREVKAYNMESYEANRFNVANQRMLRSMMRWRKALEGVGPLVEVVASLGVAGALVYVWIYGMHAGDFIALNAGLVMLYPPAKALSRVPLMLQKCLAATSKVFDLMDREVHVRDAPNAAPPFDTATGRMAFENVTFAYRREVPAIRDVSIDIQPHQTVALVGRSGAGKSTLFSLLLRLYDPQRGHVRVDGCDLRTVPLGWLRSQIGVVSQEAFLFHDTIYENIRYGRLDASRAEIEQAAQRAHAHEFIMEKEKGYDTVIGDKGGLLSGGQRQRISIARAFLKDAPILLLDEATSALDVEAERHVQEAIRDLTTGKTVLVIAHRLSTVINSDLIVVMEGGTVAESGRHDELMQRSELYRQLYAMQFHPAPT